jgi:restriction endonuclease S subunit
MAKELMVIKQQEIEKRIFYVRGNYVVLDKDLADFYEVKPIRLREQVKRNANRFPEDFMFQLTAEEVDAMVSQNAIPSKQSLGGYLPYVFTEQGVAAVSAVLKSEKAAQVSINIMRAFVQMRKFLQNNALIFQRLDKVEHKQLETDQKLEKVLQALESRTEQPDKGIFFDGQIFDAYVFVADIIKKAKTDIILIDNYVDETVLTLLAKRPKNVTATIYTKSISKPLQLDFTKHNSQYPPIALKTFDDSHDRFLIIDQKELYHLGASLKDLGKKWFAFSKMGYTHCRCIGEIERCKMKLAEKYKQTEVGLIPSDWDVKPLGLIVDKIISGGTPSRSNKEYWGNEIPWVTVKDFASFNPNFTQEFITKKGLEHSASHLIPKGTLITSTRMGLGKAVVYDVDVSINQDLKALFPSKLLDTKYLYYWFQKNSELIGRLGSGSTVMGISLIELKNIQFILPTKAEQIAIATTLSDADALISSLEKLIAKKRMIKQGAMQQLLQPKEGWVVKKLGEIGKPYGGLSGKSKVDFENGVYPYIPFMNIMSNPVIDTDYFDFVNINVGESQNSAQKGDLFFNGSSETPEEVGMCSVLLEEVPNLYLNSFCFGFRLNKESRENGLYLSYFFRSSEGRKLFYSMAQGATRYNLSKSNFNKLELKLPNSEEQTRIATILSDMDAEIAALETKLEKYRKVKLGMMQNLLTGKIRLI